MKNRRIEEQELAGGLLAVPSFWAELVEGRRVSGVWEKEGRGGSWCRIWESIGLFAIRQDDSKGKDMFSHMVMPNLSHCHSYTTLWLWQAFAAPPSDHQSRRQRSRHNHSGIRDILSRPNRSLSPLLNTRLLSLRPLPQKPTEQHAPEWGLSPSEDLRLTMAQRLVTRCLDVNKTTTTPLYLWLNFRLPLLNCQTHHRNWNSNT